jgi:hypothetical protein
MLLILLCIMGVALAMAAASPGTVRAGRGQFADVYDLNIGKLYFEGADPNGAFEFEQFFKMAPSLTDQHTDGNMGGFGSYRRKPIGDAIEYDQVIPGRTSTVKHEAYALGWMIPYEDLKDDPRGIFQQDVTRDLGAKARITAEELGGTALDSMWTDNVTIFQTGSDGVPFFSLLHPIAPGSSVTFSNRPATDIDISVAGLQAADLALTNMPDLRGKRIQGVKPTILNYGRNLKWIIAEILGSPAIPYMSSDTPNTAKKIALTTKEASYMSRTNAWWLSCASKSPLTGYWRERPNAQNDSQFSTGNKLYKGYFRLSLKYDDPRRAYGSPGSAA